MGTDADHGMQGDPDLIRQLFESHADALLLVNPAGVIVLANPSVASLVGYKAQDLHGRRLDELFPLDLPTLHATQRRAFERTHAERACGTRNSIMALHADGFEVALEIELSSLSIRNEPYLTVWVRHMQANPRVEAALRQSRYYEQLAALARQAVDLTDPKELLQQVPAFVAKALDCEGSLVYLLEPNHLELRVVSAFGLTGGKDAGLRIGVRPDSAFGLAVQLRDVVVISDFACERRFLLPPSLLQHGIRSGLVVPLFDQGQVVGVLSVDSKQPNHFAQDEIQFLQAVASVLATSLQRAQMEMQLRQAAKMESIGQLTGGIAHDFNNLLTVIQGNLQMAQELIEEQGDKKVIELLRATAGASRRAADLTSKLLKFSRRQMLAPIRIDLHEFIPSLADLLRRTLGEKILIVEDVSTDCPPCLADRAHLESALLNLAINARDAMPQGGTLSFVCRAFHGLAPKSSGVRPEGVGEIPSAWVRISVIDTGSGMNSAVLERAFEPFFTTKEAGRGTGLGLSSVYAYVKQSRGRISLESAPGTGTTATMLLPAFVEATSTVECGTEMARELPKGLRVLLLEDDALVRYVSQEFLESLKCSVSAHADTGSAWHALLHGGDFDLLMTDIDLGSGETGADFARRAKSKCPALAILLNSGHANYLDDERRHEPGRWPLLQKPFNREDLAMAILLALDSARGSSNAEAALPTPRCAG